MQVQDVQRLVARVDAGVEDRPVEGGPDALAAVLGRRRAPIPGGHEVVVQLPGLNDRETAEDDEVVDVCGLVRAGPDAGGAVAPGVGRAPQEAVQMGEIPGGAFRGPRRIDLLQAQDIGLEGGKQRNQRRPPLLEQALVGAPEIEVLGVERCDCEAHGARAAAPAATMGGRPAGGKRGGRGRASRCAPRGRPVLPLT